MTESVHFKLILLQNLIISNLVPVDNEGMFNYQENSFNISKYLKYLFDKKNIKRKLKYRNIYKNNDQRIDCFSSDSLREESIKLLKYYDADKDGALNAEEFSSIFDDLKNTQFTDMQISDSFALIDTNLDG